MVKSVCVGCGFSTQQACVPSQLRKPLARSSWSRTGRDRCGPTIRLSVMNIKQKLASFPVHQIDGAIKRVLLCDGEIVSLTCTVQSPRRSFRIACRAHGRATPNRACLFQNGQHFGGEKSRMLCKSNVLPVCGCKRRNASGDLHT